ncbi:MAG: hypothetical protein ACFB0B_16665 [Thermonemataceae bacterium]
MKKIYSLFSLVLLFSSFLMTSCDDDSDPSLLVARIDNTLDAGNFDEGDLVPFTIVANADGRIDEILVQKVVDGVPEQIFDKSNGFERDTEFTTDLVYQVEETSGSVTIRLRVTDRSDNVQEAEYTFTVGETAGGGGSGGGGGEAPLLRSTVTVDMGTEGASLGSYLATGSGTVYTSSQAQSNRSTIDVTVGVGNTGGPSLISPAERKGEADFYGGVDLNFGSPTPDPQTGLISTFFSQENDLDTDDATADEVDGVSPSSSTIRMSPGNVYSFQNTNGKKGLIKVTDLQGSGTNYTVTLDVVVQQ